MVLLVTKQVGVGFTSSTFTLQPGDWMIVEEVGDQIKIRTIYYHNSDCSLMPGLTPGPHKLDVRSEWTNRTGLVQIGTNWPPLRDRIGLELIDITKEYNRDKVIDTLIE